MCVQTLSDMDTLTVINNKCEIFSGTIPENTVTLGNSD